MNKLEREYKEERITYNQYHEVQDRINDDYIQAMKLVFTQEEYSYGLFIPAPAFAEDWMRGCFTDYDGIGYFVDWQGNEIGPIDWETYTDKVRFVAWYNK